MQVLVRLRGVYNSTWNWRFVETVNELLIATSSPIRSRTPLIRIESVEVSPAVMISPTAEVSMHGKSESIITGGIANRNGAICMVPNVLFKVPLNRLSIP